LNASVVVAARAIGKLYSHMRIYQAPDRGSMANVCVRMRKLPSGSRMWLRTGRLFP
jgi:hypothetical protein